MEPTDTQTNEAQEYSRVLSEVEREIVSAFAGHFAGKPGQYVPSARVQRYEPHYSESQEVGIKITDAIEGTHDYRDVLEVFHDVLRGAKPLEAYRSAIVRKYLDMHATDIAELRSGLDAPLSYVVPSIPSFLMKEPA